ncbi:trypsin-1-like [Uranotaenia lowii]|uniref:trypsin-1-like n=1 Tax=Uranotaenia lowii TaxID=190385 RepID=UPI0024799789|nr:trypsin-1-like [Uranotaenia lowii]
MAFKLTVTFLLLASLALASCRSAPRIVGGEQASAHEFPYQISLQWVFNEPGKETMHFCGGSLLDEYHVLTAGHCKTSYSEKGYIEVVAAEHDTSVTEGSEQRRMVASFIVHEDYDGEVGPNDIAIIRVTEQFNLNDKVATVQLPKALEEFEGEAMLSGWGSISTTPFPDYPDVLRKASLPLVNYKECSRMYGPYSPVTETNICAGTTDGSKSACSADSGGPLVKQQGDQNVQVGVVSWGAVPCGQPNRPTVFVSVPHFIDWIEEQRRQ